jgi:hypothetical protein
MAAFDRNLDGGQIAFEVLAAFVEIDDLDGVGHHRYDSVGICHSLGSCEALRRDRNRWGRPPAMRRWSCLDGESRKSVALR